MTVRISRGFAPAPGRTHTSMFAREYTYTKTQIDRARHVALCKEAMKPPKARARTILVERLDIHVPLSLVRRRTHNFAAGVCEGGDSCFGVACVGFVREHVVALDFKLHTHTHAHVQHIRINRH